MTEETIKLFKKAIASEIMAGAFYTQASETTQNDEARMIFLELASLEDDHAQELVNAFQKDVEKTVFDAQGYLDTLLKQETPVNTEQSNTILNGTGKEVLSMAIDLERAAKELYDRLADEVVQPEMKRFCLELSKEEGKHLQQLTDLLDSLDMDPSERSAL